MAELRRWFGTDGIRGRVGEMPLTPEFVLKLGWAAARVLCPDGAGVAVIGKDTRRSGYMFESVLEAGFSAAGVDTLLLGPLPTPAIAYITRDLRAAVGVVISASHNPYEDNGIKFFGADGRKLPDATEAAIEAAIGMDMRTVDPARVGQAKRLEDARGRYVESCKASLPRGASLAGLKLVLDCAHGADYLVAPQVFRDLGAEVVAIGVEPDGLNINAGYGSTYPERICAAVVAEGADYGLAFDGDGDRVLAVDAGGRIYDGDELLYVIAMEHASRQALRGPVVGTVMSNLGLEEAFTAAGIAFERAPVGDRYVLARLDETGGILGGESSGHIVCLERASTGDGIIAGLAVMHRIVECGTTLAELCAPVVKHPQLLVNVPLNGKERVEVMNDAGLLSAVASVEARLGEHGRVLLRPSGTQALIRVMVEGPERGLVETCVEEIRIAVESAAAR
ncbi:MAG: phosphoglucosamine mutase [Gammaproteobacteria bacterium]